MFQFLYYLSNKFTNSVIFVLFYVMSEIYLASVAVILESLGRVSGHAEEWFV
jgi:hypothetical protein